MEDKLAVVKEESRVVLEFDAVESELSGVATLSSVPSVA